MAEGSSVLSVFKRCELAIAGNMFINRETRRDKEFHFQNWVQARLRDTGLNFETAGRNRYPDFRIVKFTEGYEVKGLAYPGRWLNFDSNSQPPTGYHNGRTIFYIFGRYPSAPEGNSYPVLDLVVCHGDFLNADHEYVHKNKSVKGFGSYGDIMIRDRKMYVAPTPFGLLCGIAHMQTLILPESFRVNKDFKHVGTLVRREAKELIVGYTFNLRKNTLVPDRVSNPSAGKEHRFRAWRVKQGSDEVVALREPLPATLIDKGDVCEE